MDESVCKFSLQLKMVLNSPVRDGPPWPPLLSVDELPGNEGRQEDRPHKTSNSPLHFTSRGALIHELPGRGV